MKYLINNNQAPLQTDMYYNGIFQVLDELLWSSYQGIDILMLKANKYYT